MPENADILVFYVVSKPWNVPKAETLKAYLVEDNWDDYGEFETSFRLFVFDSDGVKHEPGNLKIGSFGLKGAAKTSAVEGERRPHVDQHFERLGPNAFSLGQDDSYYTKLMQLDSSLRKTILCALGDLAANEEIWIRALPEAVVAKSLLRSVSKKTVEGQFRRILTGLPRLTDFYLGYKKKQDVLETCTPFSLEFQVTTFTHPPTNIHVLIGRNGVGKSHCLHSMTKALLGNNSGEDHEGAISMDNAWGQTTEHITSLISVSFSRLLKNDFSLKLFRG